jgi:5'-phosphate synthase pdxT subunit
VGVLALQGDFEEHEAALEACGAEASEVRTAAQLTEVDGLVIPGGESTTIARLLDAFALREPLLRRIEAGMPVWGTCAGAILLAREVPELDRAPLGVMDIVVDRNAFGRQLDSFETDLAIENVAGGPFRAVFIRAPVIREPGPGVEILARLPDGRIVACRQGRLLATAFHPELTDDPRVHRLFADIVREAVASSAGETKAAREARR